MNEKERNLKFLRKLIDNLESEIIRERRNFINDTTGTDFGEFYNKKVGEISIALLEFKNVLEKLIYGLSSEIKKLNFESKHLRK